MNLPYLSARIVRHFLPERLTRFLLLHGIVIKAGLETSAPAEAVARYVEVLTARNLSLRGKRVLVFGYGGRFDVGLELLASGADHVVLCEKFAPPDDAHNAALLPGYSQYLTIQDDHPRPNPESMTLLHADVRDLHPSASLPACDYVFSSSVYEHLDDVDGLTRALAELTRPDGLQIHYVDLRDHFFKYPFEMLTYSEAVWRGWLNPTSNHNRFRLWHYRAVFEKYFDHIEIDVLGRDASAFQAVRSRVRPEFVSGKSDDDCVTLIRVVASRPGRGV